MRSLIFVLLSILLALLSWGVYGPVLYQGQLALGDGVHPSSLRPFMCVGVAYLLIAVVVPLVALRTKGERGSWTVMGAVWSFLGGVVGALGVLGMVLAFRFHGGPVYVMPLVFGLAPVVHTFVGMWMAQTVKEAGSLFFAGVILVAVGTGGVLSFQPSPATQSPATVSAGTTAGTGSAAASVVAVREEASAKEKWVLIPLSIALAALCWGSYGPLLHRGQTRMAGSRLRPFLCVGLAYLVIAVLLPLPLIQFVQEPGGFSFSGTAWSLAGGAAGAVGALGIVWAFNFGGKPIYVMPLVFGGAPIVNTFVTVLADRTYDQLSPLFLASLMVIIAGAATVLVFAPRHGKPAAAPPLSEDDEGTVPADVGRADVGRADVGRADVGPADVGPADVGPADDGRADVGRAESRSDGASGEDLEETIDREETIRERRED